MNRLENADNFETGLTSTIGLDYKIQNNKKEFDFSVAQIINEKENKKCLENCLDENFQIWWLLQV